MVQQLQVLDAVVADPLLADLEDLALLHEDVEEGGVGPRLGEHLQGPAALGNWMSLPKASFLAT